MFPYNINDTDYLKMNEGGQALEQISEGGCMVFISGDIQNPSGHKPEQPAVG